MNVKRGFGVGSKLGSIQFHVFARFALLMNVGLVDVMVANVVILQCNFPGKKDAIAEARRD